MDTGSGPIQLKGRITDGDYLAVCCAIEQLRNHFIEDGEEAKAEHLHLLLQRIEAGNPLLAVNADASPAPQPLPEDGEQTTLGD